MKKGRKYKKSTDRQFYTNKDNYYNIQSSSTHRIPGISQQIEYFSFKCHLVLLVNMSVYDSFQIENISKLLIPLLYVFVGYDKPMLRLPGTSPFLSKLCLTRKLRLLYMLCLQSLNGFLSFKTYLKCPMHEKFFILFSALLPSLALSLIIKNTSKVFE
uniref:Uncharacterized protein n=1 Tax=Glossina brevipalpis TaxID=37001 RepID=A0A1A9WGW9_9MUSC